ncbi:DUF433 domain-containing protein [Nocardioides pakistanensis]
MATSGDRNLAIDSTNHVTSEGGAPTPTPTPSVSGLKHAPSAASIYVLAGAHHHRPGSGAHRPVVRGTRGRVADVLSLLGSGASEAEILDDYPYITADDIRTCLTYAAAQTNHAVVIAS